MKCSLGISHFLEEISNHSHSTVFLYFFALFSQKVFLISPCYSLELCIQTGILFLSPFPFASLFSSICKVSSDNHFVFLHLFFLGMFLIPASCKMLGTSVSSSSGTLSDLIPWIYLSLPLYNHMGFDLGLESPLGCKEILSVHPKGRLVLSENWKFEPRWFPALHPGSQRREEVMWSPWPKEIILLELLSPPSHFFKKCLSNKKLLE